MRLDWPTPGLRLSLVFIRSIYLQYSTSHNQTQHFADWTFPLDYDDDDDVGIDFNVA